MLGCAAASLVDFALASAFSAIGSAGANGKGSCMRGRINVYRRRYSAVPETGDFLVVGSLPRWRTVFCNEHVANVNVNVDVNNYVRHHETRSIIPCQ